MIAMARAATSGRAITILIPLGFQYQPSSTGHSDEGDTHTTNSSTKETNDYLVKPHSISGVGRDELVMFGGRPSESFGMPDLLHEGLTHSVIGAFYEVYNTLGCGFLESLYMTALERELLERGHKVSRELSVRVIYKGEELGQQRLDMVVDDVLVIEAKSTHVLHRSASRQLYNYLRATNLELGLLLHFGPPPQFYRVICANGFKARRS